MWGAFLIGIIFVLVIREINAWFWKMNAAIETQENILSTLEDIRDLLTEGVVEEKLEEQKETVTEMLEKKPKKAKVEKDEEKNPPKE